MDGFAVFGALAASEGSNAMAILAPHELPPGHVSWTTKDIGSTDQAFAASQTAPQAASEQPSLLQTWMVTGACVLAWKEATFEGFKKNKDETDSSTEEPQ